MRCDVASGLITRQLLGELHEAEAAELRLHLDVCSGCLAEVEALRSLWVGLGRLPVPEPPGGAVERFSGALRVAGRRRSRIPLIGMVAGVLVGLVGGYLAARSIAQPAAPPGSVEAAADTRPRFLVLLRSSERFAVGLPPEARAGLVAEYSKWGDTLESHGYLIGGHRLENDLGRWLSASAVVIPDRYSISGFFIIRAGDYGEAEQVARSGPHLKYGGIIELRAIAQPSAPRKQ